MSGINTQTQNHLLLPLQEIQAEHYGKIPFFVAINVWAIFEMKIFLLKFIEAAFIFYK
jgi:hypothetical protein